MDSGTGPIDGRAGHDDTGRIPKFGGPQMSASSRMSRGLIESSASVSGTACLAESVVDDVALLTR